MNIALLVIDTLQYGIVGANGNDRIETPNIDRLAKDAWTFDRAFCASYPTIPHRTDVITGRYGGPFHSWKPLRHGAPAFPRLLAEAGYATQLIHDTPHLVNGGHNFDYPFSGWTFIRGAEVDRPWITDQEKWPDNWNLDPLFDVLGDAPLDKRDVYTYACANRNRQNLEDWNCMQLFTTAAQFLRDNARRDNFFLWVDCFDPHEPWDVPPEFMLKYDQTPGYDGRTDPRSLYGQRNDQRLSQAARERIENQYLAKVTWMDHCLGKFLDALESTGLSEKTALFFTADHGTNVGERGGFGKGYPVRQQEGHVPLFIRTPAEIGRRSDIIVQPQDLFTTIGTLAGVEIPEGIDGHDLLSLVREGGESPRQLALAGSGADAWVSRYRSNPAAILFTLFDREWVLEVARKAEDSRLSRLDSLDYVEAEHPQVVRRLHAAAVDEIERRRADPALVEWLRSSGEKEPPTDCRFYDGWPGPEGYTQYWNRVYRGD